MMTLIKNNIIIIIIIFFLLILCSCLIPASAVALAEVEMMMNPVVEMSSREELVNLAGYGEEKLSQVTISGKVVCHNTCHQSNLQLTPPDHHALPPNHNINPVSGASVAVLCGTGGGQRAKKSWARSSTDEYGDFLIDLPSHLHAIPNLEKVCFLKVLSLPTHSECGPSFRAKHKDIKLHSIDDGGARSYTANTITLATKPSKNGAKNRKQMHHHHEHVY